MAIDRKKMAAFAGHADTDEQPKDPDHPGKNKPGKGGGDGSDDDDMQEGGDGKFGALLPLLEQNAKEIEMCADELDPETLSDTGSEMSDEDHDTLKDSYDGLDGKLKKEMKALSGADLEDVQGLAQHLADEGMVDDEEAFAGLLFRFGQILKGGGDDGGEEEDDEGDDDEEEAPPSSKPAGGGGGKPTPPKGGKPGGGGGKPPPFGKGGKPGGGKAPPFGKK